MREAAIVFVLMCALDFVWALYVKAIAADRAGAGAGLSGAIVLLNGVVTIMYVDDPWMLIPTVAGAMVGTWLAIWWSKKN